MCVTKYPASSSLYAYELFYLKIHRASFFASDTTRYYISLKLAEIGIRFTFIFRVHINMIAVKTLLMIFAAVECVGWKVT